MDLKKFESGKSYKNVEMPAKRGRSAAGRFDNFSKDEFRFFPLAKKDWPREGAKPKAAIQTAAHQWASKQEPPVRVECRFLEDDKNNIKGWGVWHRGPKEAKAPRRSKKA